MCFGKLIYDLGKGIVFYFVGDVSKGKSGRLVGWIECRDVVYVIFYV